MVRSSEEAFLGAICWGNLEYKTEKEVLVYVLNSYVRSFGVRVSPLRCRFLSGRLVTWLVPTEF